MNYPSIEAFYQSNQIAKREPQAQCVTEENDSHVFRRMFLETSEGFKVEGYHCTHCSLWVSLEAYYQPIGKCLETDWIGAQFLTVEALKTLELLAPDYKDHLCNDWIPIYDSAPKNSRWEELYISHRERKKAMDELSLCTQ